MGELREMIRAEEENVEMTLDLMKKAMSKENTSTVELTAAGAFIHNVYNAIENIIKLIIRAKNIDIPKSETWHKDLLNISLSEGIISASILEGLFEYLAFRHFFIHGYGISLKEQYIKELAGNINETWQQFLNEVKSYIEKENL